MPDTQARRAVAADGLWLFRLRRFRGRQPYRKSLRLAALYRHADPGDGGLFYQGAIHYNNDPARSYGDDPEFDQVGCLVKLAGQEVYRLELPYPIHESTFDVIELRRSR
ncbi:DUF4893 domain-containing protein [Devosia aurantiaca]|uniref:DUF4893 domain-containing protein n=1 Tax=Devosia aurantiaca TaxID=2714858 RepID=UPI0038B3F931